MSLRRVVVVLSTVLLLGTGLVPTPPWGVRADLSAATGPSFDTSEWKTNFRKFTVPLDEIQSGGPPKDGIPAIDRPKFETVVDAGKWLKPLEPVILFERAGDARAYPLQILI